MVIAFHLIENNTVRSPNVPDIEVLPVFVRAIKQIFVGLSCPTFAIEKILWIFDDSHSNPVLIMLIYETGFATDNPILR
jgi:hypothetical protein